MSTEEEIENLKKKIITEDFLKARKLGKEEPYWIFAYPPEDELLVRASLPRIKELLTNHSINYLEIDLYELSLEIIASEVSYSWAIKKEAEKGSAELLKSLRRILTFDEIKPVLIEKINSSMPLDLILLTGIGKVFPMIRSHLILNNLQPITNNIPLVAFYPGKYDEFSIDLFGLCHDGNYYRAFGNFTDV